MNANDVVIDYCPDQMRYTVRMPRHDRLGDRTLLDEHGQPAHIGPAYREPARWPDMETALAYFAKVAENFRSL